MYQIAAVIGYAKKHNINFFFKKWYCEYSHKDINVFFENKLNYKHLSTKNYYKYVGYNFHYIEIPFHKDIILYGYFQSRKYWKHCEDLIYHYFEPSKEVYEKLKEKYGSVLNTNTCAIHVRRGDYVNNSLHEVCNLDYYNRAIDYIKSKEKIDNFLVFSDDVNWCKNVLTKESIFIEGNQDVEDLFLMSLTNHQIISNSSFGKWASILNKNKNKIVVVPSKWFNDDRIIDKDVYDDYEIKI